MKTTFFAAAIVALLKGAEAVPLHNIETLDNDHFLAQTMTDGMGDVNADAAEAVKAATLKIQAGQCEKPENKVPFEKAMLSALNEVGNKSTQLASALSTQFSKQKELQAGAEMNISGKIKVVPLSDPDQVAICDPEPKCECTAPKLSVETTKAK